jgi:peptide/nickel transport system substrate-binding protein
MKKFIFSFPTVILILALVACAWAALEAPKKPSSEKQHLYGGILKISFERGPTAFGYPPEITGVVVHASQPCLESLTEFDFEGNFVPGLTTAYEIAPDLKSVRFTLRKGVKFHDGTDWNAQAAKWNLDRTRESRQIGTLLWASTDVIDDYTLRLNLKQWDNTVVPFLGRTVGKMVSPTAVEKNGIEWARYHPVGTGPFRFVSFDRDVSVKYRKFDGYWRKGKPYLDGVEFIYIRDPMVQSAALQRGDVDVIFRATVKQAADLRAAGNEVISSISTHMDVLHPDSRNPDSPFANKKVREAVEHAIDRPAIAKALGYNLWWPVDQPCPREYDGYDPTIKGRSYDPNKAKELLAQAGYPNGFKTRIIGEPGQVDKDALVAIQSFLSKAGIDLQLEIVPRAKYEEYRETQGWRNGLLYIPWGTDALYMTTIVRFLPPEYSTVVSVLRPPRWEKLIMQAAEAKDAKMIKATTQQVVRFAFDEAMVIPLYSRCQPYVQRKNVNDTRFLSWGGGNQLAWTPYDAWLSK